MQRRTIERKTLKIWVDFGVAAPRPWGAGRVLTPNTGRFHYRGKHNCKKKLAEGYSFCGLAPPVFALTFWQNFVEKLYPPPRHRGYTMFGT